MSGNIKSESFDRLVDLMGKRLARAMSFATKEPSKPVIVEDGFTTVSGWKAKPRRTSLLASAISGNSMTSKYARLSLCGSTLNSVAKW